MFTVLFIHTSKTNCDSYRLFSSLNVQALKVSLFIYCFNNASVKDEIKPKGEKKEKLINKKKQNKYSSNCQL